jgi:hypothetical protein
MTVATSMLYACPVCGVSVCLVRRGPILVTVAHADLSGARCKGGAVKTR